MYLTDAKFVEFLLLSMGVLLTSETSYFSCVIICKLTIFIKDQIISTFI